MAVSQEKITVYNLADLKNTSDDAIPNYLNSLKFIQSHRLTDVRLALGYTAFAIAAASFLWDYKFGFDSTKYYTAAAVALYSAINGALTLWIFSVENGTVYEGTAPSGETLRIATSVQKNVPQYHLSIRLAPAKGKPGKPETLTVVKPFTNWFDAAGHFVAGPFQSMLANAIPVVGKLDPKHAAAPAAAQEQTLSGYTAEMLEALSSASAAAAADAPEATTTATGAEAAKKGGKRRKA
ncbi:microsomal signal peptidase 25 kDa subunit-domain-containing protein [Podospora appendiculata]|uniref:Signal peptidase complex subunit 2 n=1 Tax=Podospora appendiculata TaxID=314037 RepID=A0AAE0XI85_9PEZI|nr:microsomal signal peptidase 25 kDa subunit-domain-containing protein [Podospora appendiculata]